MKKFIFLLVFAICITACNKSDDPITPDAAFSVTVGNIKATTAAVTVDPVSGTGSYYCTVIDEQTFSKKYGADVSRLVTSVLTDNKWGSKTTSEIVATITNQGRKTLSFKELKGNTKYVALAVGMDANGGLTSTVTQEKFSTPDYFTIKITDLTITSGTMTVTPDSETDPYFYNVIDVATFSEYHDSSVETFIENLLNDPFQWENMTKEEIVSTISTVGRESYKITNILPSTKYIAFAVGLASDGTLTTTPVIEEFTTPEYLVDLSFKMNVLKTEWDNIDFEVVPSNDEMSYFYMIYPTVYSSQVSDEDLLKKVLADYGFVIPYMAKQGTSQEIRTEENGGYTVFFSDTRYQLVVFGFDKDINVPNTKISRFDMKTAKGAGDPATATFTFDITEPTSKGFSVGIKPTNVQYTYIFDLIDRPRYESYKNKMQDYLAEYLEEMGADQLDNQRNYDESGYFYNTLSAGSTYYVWAVYVDEYGKPISGFKISDPITLPDIVVSDITADVVLNKYFNGDEVYNLNQSKYASSQGKAYVSMLFSAQKEASLWYGGLFEENMDQYTDAEIRNTLDGNFGYIMPTGKLYNCEWGKLYTAIVFAMDADMNPGVVTRKTFTFNKQGASPISEFEEPAQEVPQLSAVLPAPKVSKAALSPVRYRVPEPKQPTR